MIGGLGLRDKRLWVQRGETKVEGPKRVAQSWVKGFEAEGASRLMR